MRSGGMSNSSSTRITWAASEPRSTAGTRGSGTATVTNGLTLNATDALNRRTEYEYDAKGNQTAVVAPSGARTEVKP